MIAFRQILCPIDFSDTSVRAPTYATAFATWYEAQLTVLHVATTRCDEAIESAPLGDAGRVPYPGSDDGVIAKIHRSIEQAGATTLDPRPLAVDVDIRKNREQFIDHARERLRAQLAGEPRTWCEIEEIVAINRAYKEILQRASASDVDLIVMGAQGHGGIELMLYGSNTQHVVRAATCPVLTVRA